MRDASAFLRAVRVGPSRVDFLLCVKRATVSARRQERPGLRRAVLEQSWFQAFSGTCGVSPTASDALAHVFVSEIPSTIAVKSAVSKIRSR